MSHSFDLLFSVALGIGLAAATGFRVFIPLLVAGLAARAGWLPLTESFAWLQSTPALVALGTAAVLETLTAIRGAQRVTSATPETAYEALAMLSLKTSDDS